MEWQLDKKRPICPQLCEQLCVFIASGAIAPGSRLLSVREAALEAGVNPNTVQKSFEQLEQQGLIYSVRGSGWYVSENLAAAQETAKRLRKEKTAEYFSAMQALGLDTAQTKEYIKEWKEHE